MERSIHCPEDLYSQMVKLEFKVPKNTTTKIGQHHKAARKQIKGYWDDVVLARFLEGVSLRYVAYPASDIFFANHRLPKADDDLSAGS